MVAASYINKSKKKLVYTVGTFDLLHVGHLGLLEYCNTLGNVAVGVASDSVVNSYKPNIPIIRLAHRIAVSYTHLTLPTSDLV